MKKTAQTLLSVLLSVLMVFCVFACGEPESPSLTVALNKTAISLTVGDTERLTSSVTGGEADTMSWTTSNAEVATVAGGTVTAVGAGSATITFTAKLGRNVRNCLSA